jgi:ComF family protein
MHEELAENPGRFQLQLVAAGFKYLWQRIKDALTPPRCLSCQSPIQTEASICITCWQKLQFVDAPVCNVMGTPFVYDQGEGILSAQALTEPPPWDKARAAVIFDDASKNYVHQLKYADRMEAGIFMARLMARAGQELVAEADIIIPVPLHRLRLWKRRFNQAAFLAKKIKPEIYNPHLLNRIRATPQQVGLDANARRKNMRNAFAVTDKAKIENKCVLLIDDVRTTGATISACVAALKKAGAGNVNVLTFALVNAPFKPHIDR